MPNAEEPSCPGIISWLKFNQDFFLNVGGKQYLAVRVDIKNFLNLLNSDWGIYRDGEQYFLC